MIAEAHQSTPSLGIQLPTDLRTVFVGAMSMTTEDILTALHKLDDTPWSNLRGKPLDSRGLSLRLRQYGIRAEDYPCWIPSSTVDMSAPTFSMLGLGISRRLPQNPKQVKHLKLLCEIERRVADVSDVSDVSARHQAMPTC